MADVLSKLLDLAVHCILEIEKKDMCVESDAYSYVVTTLQNHKLLHMHHFHRIDTTTVVHLQRVEEGFALYLCTTRLHNPSTLLKRGVRT